MGTVERGGGQDSEEDRIGRVADAQAWHYGGQTSFPHAYTIGLSRVGQTSPQTPNIPGNRSREHGYGRWGDRTTRSAAAGVIQNVAHLMAQGGMGICMTKRGNNRGRGGIGGVSRTGVGQRTTQRLDNPAESPPGDACSRHSLDRLNTSNELFK